MMVSFTFEKSSECVLTDDGFMYEKRFECVLTDEVSFMYEKSFVCVLTEDSFLHEKSFECVLTDNGISPSCGDPAQLTVHSDPIASGLTGCVCSVDRQWCQEVGVFTGAGRSGLLFHQFRG